MASPSRSAPARDAPRAAGDWVPVRPLGAGGLARVWLARHRADGREAALKVLRPELAGDREMTGRLRTELRAAASLRHEHVVHVWEAGVLDGLPFLACEYLDGGTLRDLMTRCGGRLPPPAAAGVLAMLLRALEAVHAHGLLHRDVKPGNVLLRADGTAKLGDFGLARPLSAPVVPGARLAGTPAYMSPEQAAGRALDARSDLFAAGVVLHEGLAGRHPFAAADDTTTLLRIVQGEAPGLFDVDPALPASLEGLAAALLAREAHRRPPDAAAALALLARAEPALASDPRAPVREALADPARAAARWRSERAAHHLARADALRQQGPARLGAAVVELQRALLLEPGLARARARLRALGAPDPREPPADPRIARLEFELEHRPDNAAAWRQLAALHAAESRFVKAAGCWKRLRRLHPDDAGAARKLAELLPDDEPPAAPAR